MRENVVFYVTRQYMKKNRKRTLTAFFGIFFMVMLMTCVFVGKETAFDFLERMAVLDRISRSWRSKSRDTRTNSPQASY